MGDRTVVHEGALLDDRGELEIGDREKRRIQYALPNDIERIDADAPTTPTRAPAPPSPAGQCL